MKVAILHLSDLHMSAANADWLMRKINQIVAAVWNDYYDCGKNNPNNSLRAFKEFLPNARRLIV